MSAGRECPGCGGTYCEIHIEKCSFCGTEACDRVEMVLVPTATFATHGSGDVNMNVLFLQKFRKTISKKIKSTRCKFLAISVNIQRWNYEFHFGFEQKL